MNLRVDGAFLQGVAAIIMASITLISGLIGLLKFRAIRDWWADRVIIIGERDSAVSSARSMEMRATMAEKIAQNAGGLYERLDRLEAAFDDVVAWTDSVADYAVFLEAIVVKNGLSLQGRSMPTAPPRLAAYLAEARSRRAASEDSTESPA